MSEKSFSEYTSVYEIAWKSIVDSEGHKLQ